MKKNDKFYIIDRHILEGIEMRLDTEFNEDWIQVFVNTDDHTYSQFNETTDLTNDRAIRITSDLALKIWEMVENKDIMSVKREEIKARMIFSEQYGD